MSTNKVGVLNTKLSIEEFVAENPRYSFSVEDNTLSNNNGSWAFVFQDDVGKIWLAAEHHVPEEMIYDLLSKYGGEFYESEYDRKPARVFEKEKEEETMDKINSSERKFNVSYERNGVPQAILVQADCEEDAKEYFKEQKPDAVIYGVHEATQDDMKPGKPVMVVPEGWEPKPIWVENKYLDAILEKYGLDKPSSPEFCYQMLDRLRTDCNYYLGNGNRYAGHLWAGNERDHITLMKAMWEKFTDEAKPEWLTYNQLLEYEGKMCGVEVFFTFGTWEKYPFEKGYISITAPSVQMAIAEFRRNYPDVNKGTLNCADYYWRESSKAAIREDGNGGKCWRAIVVESKDLSLDEIIAGASSRSGGSDKDAGKNDIEIDK